MKALEIAKKLSVVLCLLLALTMVFAACGGEPGNPEEPGASDVGDTGNTGDSGNNGDSGDKTTSGDKKPDGGNSTGTTFDKDYLATAKAQFSGSNLHVIMWRQYTATEKSLVDSFYKKTGIKVRTTVTTEAEYATKLAALISGKDSPDVVCFNSDEFPGFVVKSLQSLKANTFKLDDPIWYKPYMNNYVVNGKYFAVAINGPWAVEDCNYVTYYNPNTLAGLADPYSLYKQGKWNWAEAKKIATSVSKKGSNYMGMSLQSKDIYMLSAGLEFISYNGKQFSNNLSNAGKTKSITAAWNEVSTLVSDNLVKNWDPQGISNGTTGLFSAIAFGLYNEGGWFDNVSTKGGVGALKAVPVPGPVGGTAYTPVRPKVWGVAKGAKNPEAAAYFLRYFLDTANSNMDKTFYNSQFKEVYNIITSKSAKKAVMVTSGVMDYNTAGAYLEFINELGNAAPAQQTTIINRYKSRFETNIKRANAQLKNAKQLITYLSNRVNCTVAFLC